jgi:tRNA G10  N-methylase Trm11
MTYKYLFILGRNPELSFAELKAVLGVREASKKENAVLIELSEKLDETFIERLGGTIAIGEVMSYGGVDEVIAGLEKQHLYRGTKNKLNYVLWDFTDRSSISKISDYMKKRFRTEKLKATEKHISGHIKTQDDKIFVNLTYSRLIDEQFFIFKKTGNEKGYAFGRIIQRCNYEDIEKRDMGKPVRRSELSISPKLAKIMINLSGISQGEVLLDPFCGIGVFLFEALLQGMDVIGVDNNKDAVEGAKRNLKWGNFPLDTYRLILDDSRNVRVGKFNAIATEPDLGEILRKVPTKEKAEAILRGFEGLMIGVINNLSKDFVDEKKGRIVFSAPLIQVILGSQGKRLGCDINRILSSTGMRLIAGGFPEFRKDQLVGREIFVIGR